MGEHKDRIDKLTRRLEEMSDGIYSAEETQIKREIFAEEVRQNAAHRERAYETLEVQRKQSEEAIKTLKAQSDQASVLVKVLKYYMLESGVKV